MSLSRHELKEFYILLAEVLATAMVKVLQNIREEECLPDERGAPT